MKGENNFFCCIVSSLYVFVSSQYVFVSSIVCICVAYVRSIVRKFVETICVVQTECLFRLHFVTSRCMYSQLRVCIVQLIIISALYVTVSVQQYLFEQYLFKGFELFSSVFLFSSFLR